MKKLSKLLLMGVVALGVGFTACNNDIDVPVDGQEGNTHVSVALNLSKSSGVRALPNDYNDVGEWAGNDVVTDITVYLSDLSSVAQYDFEVGAIGSGEDYEQDGSILRPTTAAAIKTTAGLKEVYVLVNPSSEALEVLAEVLNSAGAFKTAYEDVVALANSGTSTPVSTSASKIADVNGDGNDAIMMTTVEPQSINVAPNVLQDETINDAVNRVSIEVERAVARVMVTKSRTTDDYTIPSADGGTSIGTLSNVTWVLAQGENSLFVQRKTDWATPNYGWVPASMADFFTQGTDPAEQKYDYSGLFEGYAAAPGFGGTTVPPLTAYEALNADEDNQAAVLASLGLDVNAVNGKFLLPTTHEYGVEDVSSYKKGNTAYVLVRAKFTPGVYADGGTSTDGTFYVGINGKFYSSAKAAYDDSGSAVITKYDGGKVLYYAWINPDEIPAWYNSPVLRNNIYHIHITGFRTLGTNWNPLYPEDPEIDNPNFDPDQPEGPDNPRRIPNTDPDNPDPKPMPETITVPDPEDPEGPGIEIPIEEPENPIDPTDPLTTPETWMSVDVTVLPWLIHSYEVELGI